MITISISVIELCEAEDGQEKIENFSRMIDNGKKSCIPQESMPFFNTEIIASSEKEGPVKVARARTSEFAQFAILLHMMMLKIVRNKFTIFLQVLCHVVCCFFVGFTFYQIAHKGEQMFSMIKFSMVASCSIIFMQFMAPVVNCKSVTPLLTAF